MHVHRGDLGLCESRIPHRADVVSVQEKRLHSANVVEGMTVDHSNVVRVHVEGTNTVDVVERVAVDVHDVRRVNVEFADVGEIAEGVLVDCAELYVEYRQAF